MEVYFFDIPIFRCSIEKWNAEKLQRVKKLAARIKQDDKFSDDELKTAESWLASDFSSYRYSELVGMIRFYAMPGQIRAETFFTKNKKLVHNQKNKKWAYMGKLLEFMVFPEMTNNEIYDCIGRKLKEECGKSYLRNRFVELTCFETTGRFIDYRKLTNLD